MCHGNNIKLMIHPKMMATLIKRFSKNIALSIKIRINSCQVKKVQIFVRSTESVIEKIEKDKEHGRK